MTFGEEKCRWTFVTSAAPILSLAPWPCRGLVRVRWEQSASEVGGGPFVLACEYLFPEEFGRLRIPPDIAIIPCDPEDVSGPPFPREPTISRGLGYCGPRLGGITDEPVSSFECRWGLPQGITVNGALASGIPTSGLRSQSWPGKPFRTRAVWGLLKESATKGLFQLSYMLSYYYEWPPLFTHQGDSEFIRLKRTLRAVAGRFLGLLVSPLGGPGFGQDLVPACRGWELSYEMGRPVGLRNTKNHHANYRSYTRCNDHYFGKGCTPLASAAVFSWYGWYESCGVSDVSV